MIRRAAVLLALCLWGPSVARADIFKFVRPDGAVVYTDKLSDLPEEKRAYYNQQIAVREQARANLEQQIGKEALERREIEAQRAEAERQARDEKERAQRLAEIDARLLVYQNREKAREAQRQTWQKRISEARARLEMLLDDFKKTQEAYDELGTRADYTLLPGQGDDKAKLKQHLKELEKQIDLQIVEVEEKIPDEARRAGIPPGWIRE